MAYVRDSDTSLWLHNKLGTNDLWSSHSICSQLDRDLLGKIPQIFPDLQSQVKLKLILAIIHIPLRNMVEWSSELKAILVKASQDTDPWVAMLADLLRTYPDDGMLFLDPHAGGFCELLNELRKLVRSRSSEQILPEECLYLNKSASNALLGQPPQPTKHFNLRKNPKSYQVKNEYVSKARESQNTKRAVSNSSVPIRYRTSNKMDGPLRGLPSNRSVSGSFRSPISSLNRSLSKTPNRKEPGIKFLEIGEQPMGRDAKRRKKTVEDEAAKKDDRKTDDEKKTIDDENDASSTGNPATPDYAAGLLSSMPAPSPAPPTPSYGTIPSISKVPASPAPKTPSHTPQYASAPGTPQTPTTPQTPPAPTHGSTPTKFSVSPTVVVSQSAMDSRPSYAASTLLSSPISHSPQNQSGSQPQSVVVQGQTYTVQTQPTAYSTQNQVPLSTGSVLVASTPGIQTRNASSNETGGYEYLLNGSPLVRGSNGTQYVIRQAPQVVHGAGLQPVPIQSQQVGHLQQVQTQIPNGSRVQTRMIIRPSIQPQQQQQQQQQTQQLQPQQQQIQTQSQPQHRNYQISQAQFNEAQEMFKNSNKVTRSEKALILGFIAGNRENPCPYLGEVITIVLNEDKRIVQQPDGTTQALLVQTHFEMNYRTGGWTKVNREVPEGTISRKVIVNPPAK